jgi:hypothetical protein
MLRKHVPDNAFVVAVAARACIFVFCSPVGSKQHEKGGEHHDNSENR